MYTTAINFDFEKKTFRITCRDLEKNKHWKRAGKDKIYETTSNLRPVYNIIYEGNKRLAEKTKYRLEDAYEMAGYTRIKILD